MYRQIADSLDDFQILTKRMIHIYARFVREELGLDPDDASVTQVNAALRKDSFKSHIREGFDIFCLVN